MSQEGWVLPADRDACHTIGQLINHFDENLAIELEPRSKDSFFRLLRPKVLVRDRHHSVFIAQYPTIGDRDADEIDAAVIDEEVDVSKVLE